VRHELTLIKVAGADKVCNSSRVAQGADNRQWKCLNVSVTDKESGAVIEYKIHYYRKVSGWYDEVRYDSHEIRRGRKTLAPHLHMKLGTPFKNSTESQRELKQIIDKLLPQIREITQ
jgi:hypothetical protein